MTELIHIKTYTSGDNVLLSKKDFKSIFEVMDKLEEKNQELEEENKYLRKLLNIGRTNAKDIIDVLNEQEQYKEENKQLKQFQSSVFRLIDNKIKEYQKYDGYDTEKYYIGTQLLKELQKKLKGDVK